jgi:hypothetical protein
VISAYSGGDDDRPVAVVAFFCGLHSLPKQPFYGPMGMVRSLILQLVMKLVEMDPEMETWGLEFVEQYGLLEGLEAHGLDELCQALQCLLREFPAGMTVFVVVDSVSCFDRDRVFEDWEYVVGCLGAIVEDEGMGVVLKVFVG